jgi:hypothetical protein
MQQGLAARGHYVDFNSHSSTDILILTVKILTLQFFSRICVKKVDKLQESMRVTLLHMSYYYCQFFYYV